MVTHGIPPDFRGGVHLFIPPYAIESVPSLSAHAIPYRWRSLPRVRWHRSSSPQDRSSNGCSLCRSPCTNSVFCLFVIPFILDVRLHLSVNMWTHQPGSRRRVFSFTPSFCGACLNFLSRERFSCPFPSSTVKSKILYPRHNRSPLVFERKSQFV